MVRSGGGGIFLPRILPVVDLLCDGGTIATAISAQDIPDTIAWDRLC